MWSRAYPAISAACVRITHSASGLLVTSKPISGHCRHLGLIRFTRLIRFIAFIELTRAHQVRPGFFDRRGWPHTPRPVHTFGAFERTGLFTPVSSSGHFYLRVRDATAPLWHTTDIVFHRSSSCLAYANCPLLSLPSLAVLFVSCVGGFFR